MFLCGLRGVKFHWKQGGVGGAIMDCEELQQHKVMLFSRCQYFLNRIAKLQAELEEMKEEVEQLQEQIKNE